MTHPNLILGGATLGSSYRTLDAVSELLVVLKKHGISHIDSAARYPPTDPGRSEQLLGQSKAAAAGFIIDTKIDTEGDGSGTLTAAAIAKSLEASLDRLQVKKVWWSSQSVLKSYPVSNISTRSTFCIVICLIRRHRLRNKQPRWTINTIGVISLQWVHKVY